MTITIPADFFGWLVVIAIAAFSYWLAGYAAITVAYYTPATKNYGHRYLSRLSRGIEFVFWPLFLAFRLLGWLIFN